MAELGRLWQVHAACERALVGTRRGTAELTVRQREMRKDVEVCSGVLLAQPYVVADDGLGILLLLLDVNYLSTLYT